MIALRYSSQKLSSFILKNWLFIILIICFINLLYYHLRLIANPFQNEYREGAIIFITNLLVKGGNPYALENQPIYANPYGIFYHLVCYPFALLFGSNLTVHRTVTAFCIWGACYLFFLATRQLKISLFLGLSATLLLYRYLLAGTNPYARPDCLGTLLFLGSIFIPWRYKYSPTSIIISVVLSILAFLTKPYFILSLPFLMSYLFFFKSKKQGVKYGVISFIFLVIAVLIASHLWETYFANTFFAILNWERNPDFAAWQLFSLLKENFLILLIPFIYINYFLWRILNQSFSLNLSDLLRTIKSKFSFLKFKRSLINSDCDLMSYGLFFFTFIFYITLGQRRGNFMVYAYQLILPFLYLYILKFIQAQKKKKILLFFSCAIALQLLLVSRPGFLKFPDYQTTKWDKLQELVSQHQNIYNSPAIVSILIGQDKKIYDSGFSQYYQDGLNRQSIWKILFPTPKKFIESYNQFLQGIEESIISKEYDLMVLTKGRKEKIHLSFYPSYFVSEDLVKKYYQYQETLPAPMVGQYWQLEIWKPK